MILERLINHLIHPTERANFLNNLLAFYSVNLHTSSFFCQVSRSSFLFADSYLYKSLHLSQSLNHFNEKDFDFWWKEVGLKNPFSKVLFLQDLSPLWKNLKKLHLRLIITFYFLNKFLHTICPSFQLWYLISIIRFLEVFIFN